MVPKMFNPRSIETLILERVLVPVFDSFLASLRCSDKSPINVRLWDLQDGDHSGRKIAKLRYVGHA
jgi:hypothetical protein